MNPDGPVLRDIHLPPAAWWPPAPGWWVLAACVLLVAAGALWWLRRHRRGRPLAAALRDIGALAARFARDDDAAALADGASRLLRRVARKVEPAAASTSGAAWRAFVHTYSDDAGTLRALDNLGDARFRAHPQVDAPALLAALRTWCGCALRRHGARHATASGAAADTSRGQGVPT